MWFRDWFFSHFHGPVQRTDPDFGLILYMGGYWQGAGHFAPTGRRIEWFVEGDRGGPGESARSAFRAIIERYPRIEPRVRALLCEGIAPEVAGPLRSLDEAFTLTSLSVPTAVSPEMSWELGYDSALEGSSHFTVSMRGWRPTGEVVESR